MYITFRPRANRPSLQRTIAVSGEPYDGQNASNSGRETPLPRAADAERSPTWYGRQSAVPWMISPNTVPALTRCRLIFSRRTGFAADPTCPHTAGRDVGVRDALRGPSPTPRRRCPSASRDASESAAPRECPAAFSGERSPFLAGFPSCSHHLDPIYRKCLRAVKSISSDPFRATRSV